MYYLLFVIVLLAFSISFLKRNNTKRSPPGPFKLPLIGSAYALGNNPVQIHVTITNLAKKYGPIYQLMIARKPFVVLTDPEIIKEVFCGADPHVLLRFVNKSTVIIDKGESLIFATDRNHWSVLRKACTPMIRHMHGGTPITQVITEEIDKLFSEMDKHINKEVHLNPTFLYFTRNVFLRILQRESWSYDDVKKENMEFIDALMKTLELSTNPLDFIPVLDFLIIPQRKELHRLLKVVDDYLKPMLDKRRAEKVISADNARDFLDMLILEIDQNPEVSEHDVIASLRSLFIASTATVADTLDWLLLFLCTNPWVQEKCYKEISETLDGRLPTMDDQIRLPYLDNVIKETFRLRPPAPLGILRIADRDFTVAGYHIEKGSIVVSNLYGIGNLETHYENHNIFDPDRWVRNPELGAKLLHFGAGPTICLGMNIAKMEVFLTAARMIQKYKFEIGPSSPKPDFSGEFKIVFNPKIWHTRASLR